MCLGEMRVFQIRPNLFVVPGKTDMTTNDTGNRRRDGIIQPGELNRCTQWKGMALEILPVENLAVIAAL